VGERFLNVTYTNIKNIVLLQQIHFKIFLQQVNVQFVGLSKNIDFGGAKSRIKSIFKAKKSIKVDKRRYGCIILRGAPIN